MVGKSKRAGSVHVWVYKAQGGQGAGVLSINYDWAGQVWDRPMRARGLA